MTFTKPTDGLRIAIIGGGIAGLAAASILRQKHSVVIYESDPAPVAERGAAIGIGPNGSKLLQRSFGISAEKLRAVKCNGTRTHSVTGEIMREVRDMTASFDSDWLLVHRQDLKDELFRLATADAESHIVGEPPKLVYGAEAVTVDPEAGKVWFKNGQEIQADVIIGADGIHSAVRPFITKANLMAQPTGVSLYRFTVPVKDALAVLDHVPHPLDRAAGGFINVFLGGGDSQRSIVIYPCRNFELLNVACCVPDNLLADESVESWRAAGEVAEMLQQIHDFPKWILDIMRSVSDVRLYKVQDMDPLSRYVRGRAIVIGDAAHPMTPFQGQGANQAIEDAEGLKVLLQDGLSREGAATQLKVWESVRKPRASQVQLNSRWAIGLSPQKQSERMHFNWTYDGIIAALDEKK